MAGKCTAKWTGHTHPGTEKNDRSWKGQESKGTNLAVEEQEMKIVEGIKMGGGGAGEKN